uniref:SFRICE_013762 n=1 Tax=Spodoptera frugiperda TaxID=7108 RepID=A0A2H1VGW6_SPOFR
MLLMNMSLLHGLKLVEFLVKTLLVDGRTYRPTDRPTDRRTDGPYVLIKTQQINIYLKKEIRDGDLPVELEFLGHGARLSTPLQDSTQMFMQTFLTPCEQGNIVLSTVVIMLQILERDVLCYVDVDALGFHQSYSLVHIDQHWWKRTQLSYIRHSTKLLSFVVVVPTIVEVISTAGSVEIKAHMYVGFSDSQFINEAVAHSKL